MRTDAGPCYGPDCDHISHAPDFARLDEEMLLGRARELLAQPAPDTGNLWQTLQHIGALKHYVAELAAALELRHDAERRPGLPAATRSVGS